MSGMIKSEDLVRVLRDNKFIEMDASAFKCVCDIIESIPSADRPNVGFVGIDEDYLVSAKEVLNITAELGALETQRRIKALPRRDRPQGENLRKEYPSLFECSHCGTSCDDTNPWDCNINYCPNCGAKMKGAEDDI